MSETVLIERRFRGPPDSANGGFACGTLAQFVEGVPAIEVTLREPPPLDRSLRITRSDGSAAMHDGDRLIAEARSHSGPPPNVPDPVSVADAERARRESPAHDPARHPFPMCFVCGPERAVGDGLGVVCGPVPGRERLLVAAPLQTGEWLGADGIVDPRFVWSALDCPSGIASWGEPGFGVSVLGRLTAWLPEPIELGPTYVAIGWKLGREGRKFESGSAILDETGEARAIGRAVWIELRPG